VAVFINILNRIRVTSLIGFKTVVVFCTKRGRRDRDRTLV